MTHIDDICTSPGICNCELAGEPASILTLAARASDAVGVYRRAMDDRADFRATVRAAAYLARTTEALTTAIADAVACGENNLT